MGRLEALYGSPGEIHFDPPKYGPILFWPTFLKNWIPTYACVIGSYRLASSPEYFQKSRI